MIKALKYALITIVVLPVVLLVALVTLFNPNDFKNTIAEQIKEQTGRDMNINGNIAWSIFPHLGISVNDISLTNTAEFSQQEFASVKNVMFSIKLLPLFRNHLDVKKIVINDLHLNLMINKHGKNNWADLIKAQTNKHKTMKQSNPSAAPKQGRQLTNLQISDVIINDANIHLKNLQTQDIMSVTNFSLKSHAVAIGKTFPIIISFNVARKSLATNQQIVKGSVDYHGRITVHQPSVTNASLLSLLQLDGDLTTGKLLLNKLHIDSVKAKLSLKNNVFAIKPLIANLYNGIAKSNITGNMQQADNKYTINIDINNIQAKSLFKDLVGSQRITGIAKLKSSITMQGNNQQQLIRSLNGNGQFAFEDGNINGIDVMYLLNWAQAIFHAQTPSLNNSGVTPFGNLTGNVRIRNGVLSNNDLLLQSPQYKVTGSGIVDLNNQALSYRVQTKVLNLERNNSLKKLEDVLGGTIPLLISGTFTDIKAQPDIKTIAKARAKTFIKNEINKLSNQDSGDIGKVATKVLNKLFN